MESPILQGLNPAQRAAVEAYDSASLIIAGAGSGKTRVLTSRIAYMIQKESNPKIFWQRHLRIKQRRRCVSVLSK